MLRTRGRRSRRADDANEPRTRGGGLVRPESKSEAPARNPDVAVITTSRDEGLMLKRWVRYYSDAVGAANLIVFDDGSVDGSTDDLECTVHRLPKFPGGDQFVGNRMRLANGVANGLLASYDWIIFADVDEFLVPDPAEFGGLVDFLKARHDREVIAGMALNVVHHVESEDSIDPDRPILDQRSFAKFIPRMCKPAVKRIPAQWRRSTHAIAAPYQVDSALFMMHMKFHDQEALRGIGDRRRAVFDADQRGADSSWRFSGTEITGQVNDALAGQVSGDVAEFVPRPDMLQRVVQHVPRDNTYESRGAGQMKAMVEQPLVRIPERLRGIV